MNTKAIRTATIRHSMDFGSNPECTPPRRVRLNLRREDDRYRWYGVDDDGAEFDTGVSGRTVSDACDAALRAWDGWELRATWGATTLR